MKRKKKQDVARIAAGIFFLAAAAFFVGVSGKMNLDDSQKLWYQMITSICLAVSILCILGDTGAKGIKKFVQVWKQFCESLAEKLVHILQSIFGFHTGKGYRGAGFINDYQDTSCKVEKNRKSRRKPWKRYKDMDNRERIRYFYGKLVTRQIKKGYPFRASSTASEIGKDLYRRGNVSANCGELFDEYNEARYHVCAEITDEEVEKIKKICKNPHV